MSERDVIRSYAEARIDPEEERFLPVSIDYAICRELIAEFAKLEAERDRLRKALVVIKSAPPLGTLDEQFHQAPSWWRALVRHIHGVAVDALQETEATGQP